MVLIDSAGWAMCSDGTPSKDSMWTIVGSLKTCYRITVLVASLLNSQRSFQLYLIYVLIN